MNLGHCIEHFHAHAKLIEEQNQILELIRNDTIESYRNWLGDDSIKESVQFISEQSGAMIGHIKRPIRCEHKIESFSKSMGPKIYVSATFDRKRVPNHLAEINNFFHIGLDVLDEMNTAILNSLNASGKNSSTFTLLKSIQVCQSVATKIQVRLEKSAH